MKKIFSIFVSVFLFFNIFIGLPLNPLVVSAESVTDSTSGIIFDTSTGTITDFTGDSKNLIIPETINGVSVTSIGDDAFTYCYSLTNITISNSVTSIGNRSFLYCTSLISITIPNSVTCIGISAFVGCESLTSITFPNSVTSIGDSAFYGCTGLTEIIMDVNNMSYTSQDGVLFNKAKTALIQCPGGKTGSYLIPNSVTSIGYAAFYECTGLTSVTIPDSVTSIGYDAFYGCTGLTSVTIPNSVTSIGYAAFYGCTGLTSVTIPNSMISIGDDAFGGCTGLTSVTIPNSVTSIGYDAFYGCTGLTSVTIGSGVTGISDFAFYGCTGLTEIIMDVNNMSYTSQDGVLFNKAKTALIQCPGGKTGSYLIPNSVTSIGYAAFAGCTGLTSVTIPNSVTSIGYAAFYECTGLTSVTIPDSVTSIGDSTFYECTGLTSVTIPDSVTSIGYDAFYGCTGLTSVSIPNSVTSIGYEAFAGCTLSAAYFLGNAPEMSDFKGGAYAFDNCAPEFKVYYISGNTGFTNPWYGYPTATFTPPLFAVSNGLQIIGNIPNGSIDYQYIPTVTISIPTTTTIIKPSDLIAQDSGVVSFYTTSDFSDANKVSDNGITINGNSIILYTKIVSSDNTVTKYYKVVFNVVNTAKKYVISSTNFAPVGSNFLATVTIDRGQASTLVNPKLLLIYTLADGETQVFLTQNALVGANEVVVGSGVSSVTAVLVDGNVDWSAGSPIYKSAFVKISIPVQ